MGLNPNIPAPSSLSGIYNKYACFVDIRKGIVGNIQMHTRM